jgi:hypothetical protein
MLFFGQFFPIFYYQPFLFLALGFEFIAYALSHSTSPFFCDGFFQARICLPGLTSNHDPPDLYLLSS